MTEALEQTDAEYQAELERDPDLDENLTARQLQALDKIEEYRRAGYVDARPHVGDEPYHSDPKIRALQLVAEGRLGGWQGGGSKGKKKKSANTLVAEWARDKKLEDIKTAFEAALESDNDRVAMDAASRLLDLEDKDINRRIREEELDIDQMDREELIAALITAFSDPATSRVVEGSIAAELEPAIEIEVASEDSQEEEDQPEGANGSAAAPKSRVRSRAPSRNGRGRAAKSGSSSPNPFKEAARRRARNR